MPEGGDKIRITPDEVRAPKADESAHREKLRITLPPAQDELSPAERKKSMQAYGALALAQPAATPVVKGFSLISSATCYTALAGALAAWGIFPKFVIVRAESSDVLGYGGWREPCWAGRSLTRHRAVSRSFDGSAGVDVDDLRSAVASRRFG